MAIFYKGAGPGTYWNINDATIMGFHPYQATLPGTPGLMMRHITGGSTHSPFISLSSSYAIARDYAMYRGKSPVRATARKPGYVYEIILPDPPASLPTGLILLDPITVLGGGLPPPGVYLGNYQHDGPSPFLIGVVSPRRYRRYLTTPCAMAPPPSIAPPGSPSVPLKALTFALRDAEVLAVGHIPAGCVQNRYPVP